ncbi:ABC transporter ATP-binding protein [Chachezhania antarctica]|uniref:ABC transporter ATP-binding protein n=1 Tax=Chachezhania antarctica TaxID=2340860 RepID=UPI000EB55B36|nr:ATP-binding cassette domain-containing protein [Chachezhania antarctica]
MDPPVLLTLTDLTKTYPGADRPVLAGVTLTLDRGQSLALTGESGSGKSTLLHLTAALDAFDNGEITLGDTAYSTLTDTTRAALRRDRLALVFQQFNLVPSLTVAQNLALHARLAGREEADWTAHLTDRLGLTDLTHRYPEHLSGGQQQRVAIGRALALRPALLLADEPTGSLDEATSDTVMALLLDLVAEAGSALLLATHSPRIAGLLDRQTHLSRGTLT